MINFKYRNVDKELNYKAYYYTSNNVLELLAFASEEIEKEEATHYNLYVIKYYDKTITNELVMFYDYEKDEASKNEEQEA